MNLIKFIYFNSYHTYHLDYLIYFQKDSVSLGFQALYVMNQDDRCCYKRD